MSSVFKAFLSAVFVALVASSAFAEDARMADRFVGKASAPIKVDEYMSLTCSHCAEFYDNILPKLEKRYAETGKVRFVLHDFPLDGVSLKAAAVARCMPEDEYFPFVKILFSAQKSWAFGGGNPEANLIQYAKLGGLPEDKAKACANDTKLQDAIIAARTEAGKKYNVEATPTFVINDGLEIINGAQSEEAFAAVFDRLLGTKK